MGHKRLTVNIFSANSIKQLQKDIEAYAKEIERKTRLFAQRLAEKGVIIAKIKIMEYDAVYTGELLKSINSERGAVIQNGETWIVYTDCPWAKFVEFGTGIRGKENSHPDTSIVGWKYDVNEHGEAGWFYYKEGSWHWTKGLPSRPFMYETGRDLAKIITKTAREVFG